MFGIPETTPGTTDTKLLELINKKMKLQPPLEPGDIEVSHRIGKAPAPPNDDQAADSTRSQTCPRPIIARFASRRIKVRVMEVKKRLKRNRQSDDSADQEEEDEDLSASFPGPVFISDDLTQRGARLAKKARDMKNAKQLSDTWVFDGRVFAKDLHGRVREIKNEQILNGLN